MSERVADTVRRMARPQVWLFLILIVACGASLGAELQPMLLLVGIWGIAGVGLGLVLGFAGQISLCQAAFVGLGAYAYAILTVEHDVPPVAAAIAGAVVSGALAALVSPILRIRGYYLAIATIVLNLLFSALAVSPLGVPGGSSGMSGVPYLELFGHRLETINDYAILSLTILVLFTIGAHLRYGRGRRWRAIQTLRHDEELAGGVGLNALALKSELFTVSGAAAGLAGAILAAAFGFVSPAQFSYAESFTLALAVFIGGSLSLWGAVFGIALLEVTAPLLGDAGALHGLLVGIVALITVRFAPDGWIRRREDVSGESATLIESELSETAHSAHVDADLAVAGATLRTRGLGRSFGSLKAVSDVDLDVSPGTIVGLIGPNGAGKSTLLNLIAGEIHPTEGSVSLDGDDVTGASPHRLARRGMIRTYQQSRIITDLSVLDNILLGTDFAGSHLHHSEAREAAIRAAADAGATRLLSKPTDSLTFGERRLVELARLLVSRPKLALLDEPLSGLSQREGEALDSVLRTLRHRGTTVVLVEHAIPFVLSLADELIVLKDGSVLAEGEPHAVVALDSVRESYLGSVLEEPVS